MGKEFTSEEFTEEFRLLEFSLLESSLRIEEVFSSEEFETDGFRRFETLGFRVFSSRRFTHEEFFESLGLSIAKFRTCEVLRKIITFPMRCAETVALLTENGCNDLTTSLEQPTCSDGPIAGGGLGDVYFGKLQNGTTVAIKTIRANHGTNQMSQLYYNIKEAAKEIYTWSKFRHANIVELIGLATFNGCLAMISRWENNGNLSCYLLRQPSANRCQLSASICAGLSYMHDQGVAHGDLKGANILIGQDGRPMLTDFGNATLQDTSLIPAETDSDISFTLRWTAPEIIQEESSHTTAGDVYSLGMTILETFTSAVPFADKGENSLFRYIVLQRKTPTRPEQFIPTGSVAGGKLWAILIKCWSYDPKDRPSVGAVWNDMKRITPESLKAIEGPCGEVSKG